MALSVVEEVKLRGDNATMKGELSAYTAWQRDPVWRRVLLEKLLSMEGYSDKQIVHILYEMPNGRKTDTSGDSE